MKLRRFIYALALLSVCMMMQAQDAVDARRYMLMKRYRAADATRYARQGGLYDSYVFAGVSAYAPLMESFSFGPTVFAGFGHQLDRYNYLEASLSGGFCSDRYYARPQTHVALSASYKFNVTSFFMGYNAFRCCEFYLLGGAQLYYVNRSFNPGAHLGADLSFHVVRNIELFFQPEFLFNYDNYSTSYQPNWRHFRPVMDFRAGLRYNLHPWVESTDMEEHPWYAFADAGFVFQNSAMVRRLPLHERFGFAVRAGMGRHCTSYIDLRAHLDYARLIWSQSETGRLLAGHYALAGADVMVDAFGWVSGENKPVQLCLLAGPRAGYIRKNGESSPSLQTFTAGGALGLHFAVRLGRGFSITLDPAATFLAYSGRSYDVVYSGENKNYYDALLGVSAGLVYCLPAHKPAR